MQLTLEEFRGLIEDQNRLKARIAELEAKPLAFSLRALAVKVLDNNRCGLTPDQVRTISEAIEKG